MTRKLSIVIGGVGGLVVSLPNHATNAASCALFGDDGTGRWISCVMAY